VSHEIENKPVTPQNIGIKHWFREEVLANKRVSIPAGIGLLVIVSSQFIPASSSSILWFLHSWGPYLGAMILAWGLFPLIADVGDEGGDGPAPP
jgi:hypothetical protein